MIGPLSLFAVGVAQAPGAPDVSAAVRGLLATVAVLALIATLAWLVRRGALTMPGRRVPGAVVVESAVPLGERRSLVVVAVEGRRLLLGLTPAQVSLVTELAPDGRSSFEAALEARTGATGRPS